MTLVAVPQLPGFQALSPLGYGPHSTIYSGYSDRLGRRVALILYNATCDPWRFQRSYEVARRLGVHPHAVTVLDWGTTGDSHPFVVTELYEHGTFESRVTGHQVLPVDKMLRIGIALCGALETAHRAQVLHGGVHPARILADSDDEPSLTDSGLVPLVDPSGPSALVGLPPYHAPPEVLENDQLSPASDVYSLGSTLYTLLAARPPYWRGDPEDTAAALLLRVLQHDVAPIGRSDVPPSLEHLLRTALRDAPNQRPPRALALGQALQAIQREIGAPVTEPVLLDVAPTLSPATVHNGMAGGVPASQAPPPQIFVPYQPPDRPDG
jgi:serine/threonine-protein kinase PknK